MQGLLVLLVVKQDGRAHCQTLSDGGNQDVLGLIGGLQVTLVLVVKVEDVIELIHCRSETR